MDFELGHLVWNLVLTGIIGPFVWFMANLNSELKRVEVLLNKTREEVARDFVSKEDLKEEDNNQDSALGSIGLKPKIVH